MRLHAASVALGERTGVTVADVWRPENTPYALAIRELLTNTETLRRQALEAEGRAMSHEEAIALALSS